MTAERSLESPSAGAAAAAGAAPPAAARPAEPATPARAAGRRRDAGDAHRPACVALLLAGIGLLILRRPDVITSPKLWAEDGAIFMKDAYLRHSYDTLFTPYSGYVHVVPRLWAALTTALPVRYLPTSYALFTLILDAACLSVVLSRRFAWLIPSFAVRAALFIGLVLLPGTWEIHGTLTNSIWYTGLCLLLLSFATDPRTVAGKAVEIAVCLLFAFTGATSVVVAVLFVARWWRTRSRHSAVVTVIVGAGGLFQLIDLRLHPRQPAVLSSTGVADWARVMVEKIGGTGTLGQYRLGAWWPGPHHHTAVMVLGTVVLAGSLALAWWLPPGARVAFGVAMVLLLGSITAGVVGNFHQLADPGLGGRYFVAPIALLWLAMAAAVPVAIRRLPKGVAWLAVIPVVLLISGAAGDARLKPLRSIDWPASARCIASHRACHVTLNPPGWSVDLPPVPSAH